MKPRVAPEDVRLAGLMLGSVDSTLRSMRSEGVADPAGVLRGLVAHPPVMPDDAVARRYADTARTLRVVFTYRGNHRRVDRAIERCIEICAALL